MAWPAIQTAYGFVDSIDHAQLGSADLINLCDAGDDNTSGSSARIRRCQLIEFIEPVIDHYQ
ncbi:MAG: hypothetical protein CMQ17_06510 [Gammaproteobacteria bacterium]|nr:hypothetical protein [Gammaproteobacteria bacterium]